MNKLRQVKVSFNSPVILGFTIICFITLVLNLLSNGAANVLFFSVYRSSMADPLTYFRFFGHILGMQIGNIILVILC